MKLNGFVSFPCWPVREDSSGEGDTSMTTNELRAAANELVHLHGRFAPLFGRKEAQSQSLIYLHGLLLAPGRKSAEPMALLFGEPGEDGISQNQVLALQRFLTYSPWDFHGIHRQVQAVLPRNWCLRQRNGRSAPWA
jgi:SRSO17 transposase